MLAVGPSPVEKEPVGDVFRRLDMMRICGTLSICLRNDLVEHCLFAEDVARGDVLEGLVQRV